jgi:WD40 repeat protein
LAGHGLLITGPVRDANGDGTDINPVAFSLVDAETGKILQNVPGPYPDGRLPDNKAKFLAVSLDERWVVAICGVPKPQIDVFATSDWSRVATIDIHTGGEKGDALDPRGVTFSPDGKTLAVVQGFDGRIKFFEVGSWRFVGSLVAFPEHPSNGLVSLGTLAFSPNGALIAVGADRGGSWWVDKKGHPTRPGWGTLTQEPPADPLRVFQVSDGKLVSSLGSFPGGFSLGLTWASSGEYLAFHDALGDIRFWNPFQPDLSVRVAREGDRLANLWFSKDGAQLAANFPDGVRVFDIVR